MSQLVIAALLTCVLLALLRKRRGTSDSTWSADGGRGAGLPGTHLYHSDGGACGPDSTGGDCG
jgi:hypothetical protein